MNGSIVYIAIESERSCFCQVYKWKSWSLWNKQLLVAISVQTEPFMFILLQIHW